MHRSTILALALAAVNTSALLAKRDSSTVTATATATGETDVVTVTSTGPADGPSATTTPNPSSSDSDSDDSSSDSSSYEDYGSSLCYPHNATNSPDLSAPCNLIAAIQAQCTYGPAALEFLSLPSDSDSFPDFNDPKWQLQSPANERVCICESQILDATLGCVACLKAHEGGVPFSQGDRFADSFPGIMAKYCDVGYTPTVDFIDFMADAEGGPGDFGGEDGAESGEGVSSYSDPIGTATDVSLYYTMSVTRSDAYNLAVPTGANGNVTFTSTRTSEGQIVPTAVNAKEPSGSGESGAGGEGAASATSSADSGAATAYAGAAGLLAVAALAAVGL
jgi:hypothetical protein